MIISTIKKFFLIFACLCVLSCSNDENANLDIIERDTFIEILAEAQQFESTQQFVKNKNIGFDLKESYAFLFEKYDITREDFEKSLKFYSSNPEDFEQIYDKVIVILTEKQATEKKAATSKNP